MRLQIDYFEHIVEAVSNIGEYLADMDYPTFLTHKMERDITWGILRKLAMMNTKPHIG